MHQFFVRYDRLSLALALYSAGVTGVVLTSCVGGLWRHLHTYGWGLVLTEAGVGIILPLVLLTRMALAVAGFGGAVLIFSQRRVGLVVLLVWALAQVPSITVMFGRATEMQVASGLASLNLQVFFAGFAHSTSVRATPLFSRAYAYYVTSFGFNVVGLALAVCAGWVLWRDRIFASAVVAHASLRVRRAIRWAGNSLVVVTIVGVLAQPTANAAIDWWQRPTLSLEVRGTVPTRCIALTWKDQVRWFAAIDVDFRLKNRGGQATTVDEIEFLLHGGDEAADPFGALLPYRPAGLPPHPWQGADPWPYVPKEVMEPKRFSPIRLEARDMRDVKVSFLLPFEEVGSTPFFERRQSDSPSGLFLKLNGRAAARTVDGQRAESMQVTGGMPCTLLPTSIVRLSG